MVWHYIGIKYWEMNVKEKHIVVYPSLCAKHIKNYMQYSNVFLTKYDNRIR